MNRNTLHLLAGKSFAGLTELGVALAVVHCTPAQLTGLITDAATKRQLFKTARAVKTQAFLDLRTAREEVDTFCEQARDYLKPALGTFWSGFWAAIGFEGQSLGIPSTDGRRLPLLDGFKAYFTANPAKESTEYNLTAGRAEDLRNALAAAMQAVTNCKQDTRNKRDAQDTAERALEKKLRALWKELEAVLDPMDTRWLKFIDRIPGDPRVPEPVDEVTATAQPGGIIALDWENATRAARYKVLKQVVGVDAEPVLATTVDNSDAQLTGLPSGATVKLQIVATNSVGDAAPSEVIELQAA